MILEFTDVSYKIPNGDYIYKNINLKFLLNQFYGVLGKNGAGKSTLIEMIMGMRKLEQGVIKVFGEDSSSSHQSQKNKIFILTHDITIPSHICVRDMFQFYRYYYPNYSVEIEHELLALLEIDQTKKFGTLSTGQKIKAMLCCAFATQSELYLFDEVTAVLDPKSRKRFFSYLKKFREIHSCTVIMATNIAEDLVQTVDKVLFVNENHNLLVKDISEIDNLFEEDHIEDEVA